MWFDQSGSLGLDGRVDDVADALYRTVETSFCFGAFSSRGRECDESAASDYVDCGFGGLGVGVGVGREGVSLGDYCYDGSWMGFHSFFALDVRLLPRISHHLLALSSCAQTLL